MQPAYLPAPTDPLASSSSPLDNADCLRFGKKNIR
jgi:hypothetical protein